MSRLRAQEELSEDEYDEEETQTLNPGQPRTRIGRTDWCMCGGCRAMSVEAECVCCQEQSSVLLRLMEWKQTASCVLEHPFFVSVCLNPYALQTIYSRDKKLFGYMLNVPLYRKYQIVAYRTFVEHFHHSLRGTVTTPLPACVLTALRQSFHHQMIPGSFPGFEEM